MVEVKRHLLKTISYRILGTTITVLGILILGGSVKMASIFGIGEFAIKPLIYFLHERIWYKWIKFGLKKKQDYSYINKIYGPGTKY